MTAQAITPARVRYIKLGEKGGWERECRERAIVRIGFGTGKRDLFELCRKASWSAVTEAFAAKGKDKGTATRFTNELRLFFEDDGSTLWITLMDGCLYWGMLEGVTAATRHEDGDGVWRPVVYGWRNTDRLGDVLSMDKLSGALTKVAAYRGTSCDVDVADYAVRRINGEKPKAVEHVIAAVKAMNEAALDLIRLLTPKDFELLVDLVFTNSGWRRVGVLGKTQATLDLDLILPSTGERAFVQVKSRTTSKQLSTCLSSASDVISTSGCSTGRARSRGV